MLNPPTPHTPLHPQLPQCTCPVTIHPLGQRNAALVTPLGYHVASGEAAKAAHARGRSARWPRRARRAPDSGRGAKTASGRLLGRPSAGPAAEIANLGGLEYPGTGFTPRRPGASTAPRSAFASDSWLFQGEATEHG